MAVATGLLIAGLIGQGVTSAIGAKKQATAAKDAAKIQSASADKAMALQREMADRSMAAQNQAMYGNPGGPGGGGSGSMSGVGGGIQGAYNPYLASSPATLSALHSFLGIPGASQNQTAVPQGGYGPPMNGGGQPPPPMGGAGGQGAYWSLPAASQMAGGQPPQRQPGMPLSDLYQSYRVAQPRRG